MRIIIFSIAFMLAGCASADKTDTRHWNYVTCNGFAGWGQCYREASNTCPDGYDMANKTYRRGAEHRSFEYACKRAKQ